MCQARGTYSASHFSMVAFASRIASPSAARAFCRRFGASVHLNMLWQRLYRDDIRIQSLAGFFRLRDASYQATTHRAQKIRVTGYLLWDDDHNGSADVGSTVEDFSTNRFHWGWRWPYHFVKVSERGQITTSIGSCPRDLLPHLLLDGEPIVSCDIANAHWNFLPLILANRLNHVSGEVGREGYLKDGWGEHNRLVALLSDGDFYRAWCADPRDDAERHGKKNILNILLNSKNEGCENNVLYCKLRAEFPITFRIIEDIKRKDHRNLSKQLHRFTADAVAAALLEEQRNGVALIPHVDALICQEKNRERVCKALGKEIFEATGVCSSVGGIRYWPLTDVEAEALAFEESAPSDDAMSYDEWEAVRLVKCVAAMKLL